MTQAEPQLVKISELARMSGVASPTIKHYMREGLLPGPARRTSRNMAYYDSRLAERVRAIKNLQQSHFLPLKLIGEVLEPAPSPALRTDLDEEMLARLRGIAPAIESGIAASRERRSGTGSATKMTRTKVLQTLNLDDEELDQLEELGLSIPTKSGRGAPYYTGADLDIIEVIHETRERGLGDLFPMEILEPYVACVRGLVRMELELFRRRVLAGAVLPDLPLDEVTRDATDLGERLICGMRNKLVLPELNNLTSNSDSDAAPENGKTNGKSNGKAKPSRRK